MSEITIMVDGDPVRVAEGTVLAVALREAGVTRFRQSIGATPRAPLCGMGICGECRVTLNGVAHQKSCQTPCEPGMEVITNV